MAMCRLLAARRFSRPARLLHSWAENQDQVLGLLCGCSAEEQVFSVISRNKPKLSVRHVAFALDLLWQFQKERPQMLRMTELVRSRPEFLTLHVLAENKITLMDDETVVNVLYNVLRLNVVPHDTLVQQLVTEAWLRLDRLQMPALSKFAICLNDQHLQHSPLMGQIAEILSQKVDTIQDARVLSTLMISVSALISPRLRDALVKRADTLLDTSDPSQINNPRRVVQFLRNVKHSYRPLLEKCNSMFLSSVANMDAESISIILGLYQSLQFNNCAFRLAAKDRLMSLVDCCTDPVSFTKLFVSLGPMAKHESRESLERTALLLADELNAQQALALAETLEEIQSKNLLLIKKIGAVIHKNLELYKPAEVARITRTLVLLRYQNPDMFSKLRDIMMRHLQVSVFPYEVTTVIRILSMLPYPWLEEPVLSRVDAVLPQCNLSDLNTLALAITKWELKYLSGEWFEEILLEETMSSLQRLMGQISGSNVPELALFLTKTNYLCTPIMDYIAAVVMENIQKIHYSAIYTILLPFTVLNYDPPNGEDFFRSCIQRFTAQLSSFDPHLLVLLGYSLAVAHRFPEELIREIFNVDFLTKLDCQLESLPDALNLRIRLRLMELNRAVCLECPELQVPWFHERYCQQLQRKGSVPSPVQQQIHRMLGELLGGMNYVRAAVVTPYFYTVDFEFVLDRHRCPLPHVGPNHPQIMDVQSHHPQIMDVQWEPSCVAMKSELSPGTECIAVDYFDSKSFCKNSHHVKGEVMMRKRHLEILGYNVIQIPHFEWNSMELSTEDAWKDYLRRKIFYRSMSVLF
ncbi:hypothetical protein GJAV_G00204680 [Gymnothorax javanicus]|nr:hypothetical protein GJAV_G00204680 [Gymnothorax javanicus]